MAKRILLFFMAWLAVSCTGMSTAELEDLAFNCKPVESAECTEYRADFERRLAWIEKRKELKCPDGLILFIDAGGRASCMSARDLKTFTGPFQY